MEIKISDDLKKLATAFEGKLYVVGGYVRNAVLKYPCDDIDICAPFDDAKAAKKCEEIGYKCKVVNEKLGTMIITSPSGEHYEYTPFRKENYLRGNHAPDKVEFVDNILLDAKRRDFTCNAVYYNISSAEVFDPYCGIKDTVNGVIKCVETPLFVFSSDGLRILRLVRFASELNFKIDVKTFKAASEMVFQLNDISAERKLKELSKIVTADFKYGATKNDFIKVFNYLNIYPYLFNMISGKFQISTKGQEYEAFFKLPTEARLLGFLTLVLINRYGFKYMQEGQVNGDIMHMFNSLKLSKDQVSNLTHIYLVLQQLKYKPLNEFIAVSYHNLTKLEQLVINVFCDVKPVCQMLLQLKLNGIPLSVTKLDITPDEIKEYVPENRTSQVLKLLFEMCLTGRVKNENAELIKVLKSIKLSSN